MDSSKLVKLGLVAGGGYLAYKYLSAPAATAAPATTVPISTVPVGSTTSVAQTNLQQVGTPTGGSITDPSTGAAVTGAVGAGGVAQRDTTVATSVLYRKLRDAITAQGDTNFTGSGDSLAGTPYHFNFYLNTILNGAAPDPSIAFPGIDLNQPMPINVYWAGVSKLIAPSQGLSGLFGLGQLPMCSDVSLSPGFVGPVQCDDSAGPVDYSVSQSQLANALAQFSMPSALVSGGATSWLNQNFGIVMAGGAAVLVLALMMGGRR